jgi:hypothetical protein
MNKEKDQLFEQTEAQRNPYLARPEDFEIMSAADAARRSLPGHSQSGDNLCQYLSLVKTSCTWRMNDLETNLTGCSDTIRAMIWAIIIALPHLLGLLVSAFSSRENLVLENLALRQQLLALHAHRPSSAANRPAKAVLSCLAEILVWVEATSHSGHTQNRHWLASGWLPAVLEMAFKN